MTVARPPMALAFRPDLRRLAGSEPDALLAESADLREVLGLLPLLRALKASAHKLEQILTLIFFL